MLYFPTQSTSKGDVMKAKWFKKDGTRMECSIKSCFNKVTSLGFCAKHYTRFLKFGDPNKSILGEFGLGFIEKGYRAFKRNGKKVYEHRLVMEKMIGRELKSNEIVHHIDKNTLNNVPENLELLNRAIHMKIHKTTTFRSKTHKQCTNCRVIKPRWMFDRESKKTKYMDTHLCKCKDCRYVLDKRHKGKYRWHKNRF